MTGRRRFNFREFKTCVRTTNGLTGSSDMQPQFGGADHAGVTERVNPVLTRSTTRQALLPRRANVMNDDDQHTSRTPKPPDRPSRSPRYDFFLNRYDDMGFMRWTLGSLMICGRY